MPKSSVTGVFSELNQYRSSIRTVSDQYAHICIRPVRTACLRAVFAELIQSCRTDTDPIYSSVSDPLPKSSVAFLGTDLDQIGSTSDSKCTILLCTYFRKNRVQIRKSPISPLLPSLPENTAVWSIEELTPFFAREMDAIVVLSLLMSLLLVSLLVVSAAASGGQHGASEYRLALSQSITVDTKDLKNIKNVKRCRDGMPKSMRTR